MPFNRTPDAFRLRLSTPPFNSADYDVECAPALCKIARDAGQEVPEWLAKYERAKESKQWRVADAVLKIAEP